VTGAIHEATTIKIQGGEGRGGAGESLVVHHGDCAPGGLAFQSKEV